MNQPQTAGSVKSTPGLLGLNCFDSRVPGERLAALRCLVFGFGLVYLVTRARALTSFSGASASDFSAIGVWSWLSTPLAPGLIVALYVAACLFTLAAVLGYRYAVSSPLSALLILLVTSYRNCWGMVFHTDNLLVFHSLVLAVAPAADAYALTPASQTQRDLRRANGAYAWPIFAISLITVLSYFAAGFTKLKLSGAAWADGEILRSQIAFDALRKIETGSSPAPFADWLVNHPSLFEPLSYLTLLTELLAPLALWGGHLAIVWCVLAWGFHAFVVLFMLIVFPYPLCGVAFASFLPLERLFAAGQTRFLRLRKSRVSPNVT